MKLSTGREFNCHVQLQHRCTDECRSVCGLEAEREHHLEQALAAGVVKLERPCSTDCPKCKFTSGDDWSQCEGSCPMSGSPHFNEDERRRVLKG